MKNIFMRFAALLLAAAISLSAAGCAQKAVWTPETSSTSLGTTESLPENKELEEKRNAVRADYESLSKDSPIDYLEAYVFADDTLEDSVAASMEYRAAGAEFVVFLSICDTLSRASVFSGTGATLSGAWESAEQRARVCGVEPVWVKADIVRHCVKVSSAELNAEISREPFDEFFRMGISLDDSFDNAFLEAELNGNRMIDYDADMPDLQNICEYLHMFSRPVISSLPDEYILFNCAQFFCDENGDVFILNESYDSYGRRTETDANGVFAYSLIESCSQYLVNLIGEDGKFIYGYYPIDDREIENYNVVRHAGTLWSLILQYNLTGNENMAAPIKSAVKYLTDNLTDNFLVWRDEQTAYIVETKSGEIKLGGCAVAVVCLLAYMKSFSSDEYSELVVALGNGILTMLDAETGKYTHVLSVGDFSVADEYRTVYYDGEATFALAALYGFDTDEKWIDSACIALDRFIRLDYTQYCDHWIAYCVNEVTKYRPKPEYFDFGLRNVQVNLDEIYKRRTTFHTYMELLMISFELYKRMIDEGTEASCLETLDKQMYLQTIYKRADYMLNGFGFPEYAMYLKNPQRLLGTFFVRHDNYRIRIDDVQHFAGGYYYYCLYYDDLEKYLGGE